MVRISSAGRQIASRLILFERENSFLNTERLMFRKAAMKKRDLVKLKNSCT
jgi:hypothetical protein